MSPLYIPVLKFNCGVFLWFSSHYVLQHFLSLQLPNHDITLEAGWPQLFIDHRGEYWDVPESISLNMSSIAADSPLQYRFGLHKSSGHPVSVNTINDEAPDALMPGLCAKAAFSYEQSKDIWRVKETRQDYFLKTKRGNFWCPAYDVRLKEPHATVSAVIGNFSWLCSTLGANS